MPAQYNAVLTPAFDDIFENLHWFVGEFYVNIDTVISLRHRFDDMAPEVTIFSP